jgi:CRP-like cAMP-binding protein
MTAQLPSSMLAFLEKLEVRSRFSDAERKVILDLPFRSKHVGINQDFVTQGECVAHSSFVLEGMVGTFGQNRRGERQITSVFMSGEIIDLTSVVVPEAIASVQALMPTTILQIPHAALRKAAAEYPGLAEAFWRECVIEASILNQWVMNVGRRPARARMAHLFCEIACRSARGPVGDGYCFPFPINQMLLADMLGLTAVHVNRTLKDLRVDGIVELIQRTVQVLKWERLTQVGEFDADYLRLKGVAGCASSIEPAITRIMP